MTKTSRGLTLTLLVLTLWLGFGLRAYHLGAQAIWGDEAFSITLGLRPLAAALAVGADLHPPLYHALLHFWLIAAGSSEFGARFLSLMAGVLLIPATYVTGRRLAGHSAGLVAAGLLAVSPFAMAYSQEARMYALAALMATLSVYFAARLWDASGRLASPAWRQIAPWAAGYLLATLAAMFSHFYAFLVIAAQDVYAVWLWRKRPAWLAWWLGGQIALALAFLPWLAPQVGFFAGRTGSRPGALSLDGLAGVAADTFKAFSLGQAAPDGMGWGLGLMLIAGLAGLAALRRRAFAAVYLILPILLAWLTAPLLNYFHPRFLLVALPAYLILVAAGLAWIGQGRRWPIAGVALAGALAASGIGLGHLYTDPAYAKSGYREMMGAIDAEARAGDTLFLLNPEQTALFDYYGDPTLPKLVFPLDGGLDKPQNQARLERIAHEDKRIWLVMFGNARDWDPGGALQKWLSDHAFRASRRALIDTEVELYVIGQVEPSAIDPVDFGGLIRLEGYGVSAERLAAGDTLQIALAWRATAKMDTDYTIFTHLIDGQGKVIGQFDGQPLGGAHPTSAWEPGEQNIDRFGIQVDPGTPPGTYWLEVGWYDLSTLERLPVLDAAGERIDDRALLVQITIGG